MKAEGTALTGLMLLMIGCDGGPGGNTPAGSAGTASGFTLVYSNNLSGEIEPCG